ncbi:FGGY family carbohydrate kinase [Oerskovia sp. M15]
MDDLREAVVAGNTALGIELGSTRIKACLVGPDGTPIASGSHEWENEYTDRTWTYSLDAVRDGMQHCYADLVADVERQHGVRPTTFGALGVSAMMHGYLAFDADDELLVPFRTWRNTTTAKAAAELSELFDHNVPQRWSVAHLYQAILDDEQHVARVASSRRSPGTSTGYSPGGTCSAWATRRACSPSTRRRAPTTAACSACSTSSSRRVVPGSSSSRCCPRSSSQGRTRVT